MQLDSFLFGLGVGLLNNLVTLWLGNRFLRKLSNERKTPVVFSLKLFFLIGFFYLVIENLEIHVLFFGAGLFVGLLLFSAYLSIIERKKIKKTKGV